MLIQESIEKTFYNNFHNLYDIVKISISGLPDNIRYCINVWACLIKSIKVRVMVRPEGNDYFDFDNFEFSISDRYHEMEHGRHNHIQVGESTWAFQLIPYDYLKEWRVYLFGLEKRGVDFKVDMKIIFNDTDNIFLKIQNGEINFNNLEVNIDIFPLENFDNIFKNTQNNWKNELEQLTRKIEFTIL